jgi:uncharacterized protein YaaN involved in tellurite resistance
MIHLSMVVVSSLGLTNKVRVLTIITVNLARLIVIVKKAVVRQVKVGAIEWRCNAIP